MVKKNIKLIEKEIYFLQSWSIVSEMGTARPTPSPLKCPENIWNPKWHTKVNNGFRNLSHQSQYLACNFHKRRLANWVLNWSENMNSGGRRSSLKWSCMTWSLIQVALIMLPESHLGVSDKPLWNNHFDHLHEITVRTQYVVKMLFSLILIRAKLWAHACYGFEKWSFRKIRIISFNSEWHQETWPQTCCSVVLYPRLKWYRVRYSAAYLQLPTSDKIKIQQMSKSLNTASF